MQAVTNQRVVDILKAAKACHNLPSPRGVALELLRLVATESATAKDVARVVEKDPAISARILRAVNSPLAGVPQQYAARAAAAAVYTKYKQPILDQVAGAKSKDLLIRGDDVQVLHGFTSEDNAKPEVPIGLAPGAWLARI